MDKKIIIWGAGKIGRGFIADLFHTAGYSIIFVDSNQSVVDRLNGQSEYTVYKYTADGRKERSSISGYSALHTSQKAQIDTALDGCGVMALSVLPESMEACAAEIAQIVRQRAAAQVTTPLDIIVCANMIGPSEKLNSMVTSRLAESEKDHFNAFVGLIDSLIGRIAMDPAEDLLKADPLAVVTNGYPTLPLDQTAFKGEAPQIEGIALIKNMPAQALRKFYTYNLLHAVYAYLGYSKGYQYISESIRDEEIRRTAQGALGEVGEALAAAFGFSKPDMDAWIESAFRHMNNPVLEDTVERVGADTIRKLQKQDRLTGPALLCQANGVWPYYLAQTIAYAFLFDPKPDANAQIVREYASYYGAKEAARKFCGLDMEPELLQLISRHYNRATAKKGPEDPDKVAAMKKAYHLGYMSEKVYKGCAQCTLDALFTLTGQADDTLFQSASAFSGGMAISGDGVCGGYAGGLMYMGSRVGRRLKQMKQDGDKEAQYISYTMAQALRDRFIETYGGVICGDVHTQIFGRPYCLRTKAVRNEFEAAGAHTTKCTNVVGTACAYIAEILYDTGYLSGQ